MLFNVRVGDEVIAYGYGRGVVSHIVLHEADSYPIRVEFNEVIEWFSMYGKYNTCQLQPVCFPIASAPQHLLDMFPRPKKIVRKEIDCFVNYHPGLTTEEIPLWFVYENRKEAIKQFDQSPKTSHCAVPARLIFEVEE